MKRILAIILCLALFAVIPACKPDNIQAPADIITPQDQTATESGNNQPTITPLPQEEEEEDVPTEETPSAEEEETLEEETLEEEPSKPPFAPNPLAAEEFNPSLGIAPSLPLSGIIKPTNTLALLKNRTISFYAPSDSTAFSYLTEDGKLVNELEWMKSYAKENGFAIKYHLVPTNRLVSSQRLALMAGKDLSLIRLDSSNLASGLTLCSSFKDLINEEITSFGVSKTVMTQSDHKLLAPMGNVESIWYDPDLFEEESPASLQAEGKWTMDSFKDLCLQKAEESIQPMLMQQALPFATLSGKSPITLKAGKLDTNVNSIGSKKVWTALKAMNKEIPTVLKDEDTTYSLAEGNVAMEYTALPVAEGKQTYQFAPLPALDAQSNSTVTFTGAFLALPKFETNESERLAALTFAELWCNRYTEARAAQLRTIGIQSADYEAYLQMAEEKGMLILYDPVIQEMIAPYLKGLTDDSVNMPNTYSGIITKLYAYVDTQNIYY